MAKQSLKKTKKRFAKKDLDSYKEKLFNLRDDISSQIRDISEDTLMKTQKDLSGDISGYSLHMADVASDNYERDFNIGLVSNERRILNEVEEALKRIEDGTYGICQMCGKQITKTRLNVIPHTRYTKKCQEQLEKDNKA